MNHLKLVGSIWHWRISVPPDLRAKLGRQEIHRSTRTGDKRIADRVARQFTADTKRKFEELRRGRTVSSAELTAVAQRVLCEELRRNLEAVKQAQGSGEEVAQLLEALDAGADVWRQAMPGQKDADGTRWSPLWSREADNYIAKVVKLQALPVDPGSAQYHELAGKIARAMVQAYTVPIKRLEGDYSAQPWDDLNDPIADVARPDRSNPRVAISGGPLLSEMFEKWLREQAGKWSPQTAADYRIGLDLFKEVAGDLPVGAIRRDDMRAVRDVAQRLPAGWRKLKQYRGRPAREIAADEAERPLKPSTVNRYLQAIKGTLDFCVEEGLLERNEAAGVRVHDAEPVADKRKTWDVEQLNAWFSSAVYQLPRESWDHRQWLPLLALFSGARREELAKLRVQDVRPVEGMLCLDIRWTGDGGRLKTKSAERYVPVHGSLLALGFADYVAGGARRGGGEMLWPHLKQGARGWGSNFGKWFTREKRNAGITDPKLDFHSFRSTVVDVLLNKGVPLHDVKALVGHSQGKDVTQTSYRKSFRVAFMRQIVDRIAFDGLRLPG